MSQYTLKRSRYARRATLAALVCVLPQFMVACSSGPQVSVGDQGAARTANTDPIDGLPPSERGAAPATKPTKPAAPAKPAVTEAEVGIPFYPGATPYVEPGSTSDPSTIGPGITITLLQTRDSIDKVLAFYQDKLAGPDDAGKQTPPSKRESALAGKPAITLSQVDGRTVKAAEICQSDNVTIIELMRMETSTKGNLPGNIPGPSGSSSGTTGSGTSDGMGPAHSADTGSTVPNAPPLSGSTAAPGKPTSGTKRARRTLEYP